MEAAERSRDRSGIPSLSIVLMVADLLVGGAEMNVVNLATVLMRRGHKVTVLAGGGPLATQLAPARIAHAKVAMRLRLPWSVLSAATRLAWLAHGGRIDIVHSFMASASVTARLARALLRVWRQPDFRLVVGVPGLLQNPDEPRWLSALRLRLLAGGADVVLAPSAAIRDALVRAGVPGGRIQELPFNATILSRFAKDRPGDDLREALGLTPDDLVVCSVARLHPLKRQDLLLRAAPVVLRISPRAKFLLVGDGPSRPQLQQLAASLGVAESVRFVGERRDVANIFQVCDVLSQTTHGPGGGGPGIAVIEAMAAGCPVVAMEFPDLREAVRDSSAAVLVPYGDVEALGSAIGQLLLDPEGRARMGLAARELAEARFDFDRVAKSLELVYRRL